MLHLHENVVLHIVRNTINIREINMHNHEIMHG